jgi:hypothetical protein
VQAFAIMLLSLPIHVALLISAIVVMVRRKTFLPFPIFDMIKTIVLPRQAQDKHREKTHNIQKDRLICEMQVDADLLAAIYWQDNNLAPFSFAAVVISVGLCLDYSIHVAQVEKRISFFAIYT